MCKDDFDSKKVEFQAQDVTKRWITVIEKAASDWLLLMLIYM